MQSDRGHKFAKSLQTKDWKGECVVILPQSAYSEFYHSVLGFKKSEVRAL